MYKVQLRPYPNNWWKSAVPFWGAECGLRLNWGNDHSERPQATTSEADWPCR